MRSFLILLLMAACTNTDTNTDTDTDNTDTDTDTDTNNDDTDTDVGGDACERAKMDAFNRGNPWTPQDVDACYAGCAEAANEQNFDQGRLACLTNGDYCPECVSDRGRGQPYQIGYEACYADTYTAGYVSAGCQPA